MDTMESSMKTTVVNMNLQKRTSKNMPGDSTHATGLEPTETNKNKFEQPIPDPWRSDSPSHPE